jgi:type I restriction enzyme S subunit
VDEAGYLSFFFRSPRFQKHRDSIARGANIQNLRFSQFEEIELEIPAEQGRIAERLEAADRLRRTRRYALDLSATFLPAAFLQLFGDPVTNPRGWERAHICDLGEVETGSTPPREDETSYGNAVEWIKSDNIALDAPHPTRAVEMLSEKGAALGTTVDVGSLLVTCIAGSLRSIGNVVITNRRVGFNQQINAITPRADVVPLFLYGLILVAKPLIQRSSTEAMKKMITKSKLEELLLIKPPLALQQQYAGLVARVERLRAVQREALRQAEHLFQSLLDEAFAKG